MNPNKKHISTGDFGRTNDAKGSDGVFFGSCGW